MDYSLRGKCKEMSQELIKNDPALTLVRGWYDCPVWGEQQHWWTVKPDGTITDPTKDQFPSGGIKEFYRPFKGVFQCAECGVDVKEENAETEGSYAFCSTKCHGKFIGVF